MKITFEMSGGFAPIPSLSRPVIIDTVQMDPQAAQQLKFFVQEALFFDQPEQSTPPAKGAADLRTYTLTVEDGARVHTVQLTDPIKDAALERFVSHLQTLSRPSTS